jgi:two-component system NarL family sensor kinase
MSIGIRICFTLLLTMSILLSAMAQPTDPLVDSLKLALRSSVADSNRVKLLMDLGNNVGYYDAKAALDYAHRGLGLSKKIKYRLGEGRTHYLLGNTYLDLGDYQQSKTHLDTAAQIFRVLKRPDMLGKIHNARGNWHYLQSELWQAAREYGQAVDFFHRLKDTLLEVIPYQNLIAALGETKNYERAITRSKRLLAMVKQRGDSLQMAYCYYYLSNNYIALNQLSAAEPYLEGLLAFVQASKDYGLAADAYHVIGLYHFKRKEYQRALAFYQQALEKALRGDYQSAQYHHAIGRTYLRLQDLPAAGEYLHRAEKEALSAETKDLYDQICRDLGEYYAQVGKPALAYQYLQKYTHLNDSILVAETRQYTGYLEAAFAAKKQESEILRLKTEKLEKDLLLKKRNNYLLVAMGILALFGTYFAFKTRYDRNQRQLLEQDKKLQAEQILSLEKEQQVISLQSMITGQESERNRIAKDLHDGLGGLFSTIKMYFSTLAHEQPVLGTNPLFQKSIELTHTASEELRRIAHNLMPEVLQKLGLINAIQDLCNQINTGRLLNISLQAYGMEARLNPHTEIMLYRIVQELLNNIIKHAQATEVIIQFNRHDERLSITIEDNGRGFNAGEDKAGAGLSTIQSRVNYLNGELNIDSTQGVGTTVMMEFLLGIEELRS